MAPSGTEGVPEPRECYSDTRVVERNQTISGKECISSGCNDSPGVR